MAKLTLSVDSRVVVRAKRYAKIQGISVSQMVEGYLSAVAQTHAQVGHDAPILRSLRGLLKSADTDAYKRHLEKKYR